MGVYDRDYIRDDGGGFWGAVAGHRTTWTLIAVNVGLWLFAAVTATPFRPAAPPDPDHPAAGAPEVGPPAGPAFDNRAQSWLAYHHDAVMRGQVWRVATARFAYSFYALFGLALGMFGLWVFGSPTEEIYGPREFLGFYLAACLVTGLADVVAGVMNAAARSAGGGDWIDFGPEPVLDAVFVLYACHYPFARVRLYFLIPVPVWVLVAFIVGASLLSAIADPASAVPILAAVGFTFAYWYFQVRVWPPVQAAVERVGGLFAGSRTRRPALRVRPADPEPVRATASGPPRAAADGRSQRSVDEQLEAELDHVLEKVSRFGKGSLTPEENEVLRRASEIYKRRRGR